MTPRFLAQAVESIESLLTELGKTVNSKFGLGNQEFGLGHVNFERPIRHITRDIE